MNFSLLGLIKVFFPVFVEYLKELLIPWVKAKKTTPLERILVLAVIFLTILLAWSATSNVKFIQTITEKHRELIEYEVRDAAYKETITRLEKTNGALNERLKVLQSTQTKSNEPKSYNDKTIPKPEKPKSNWTGHRDIINDINNS